METPVHLISILISNTFCLFVSMHPNSQVEISATMSQLKVPDNVLNDLKGFIVENYSNYMPNSLLIAQKFILRHQDYGREFGLSAINHAIEDGIKEGCFN